MKDLKPNMYVRVKELNYTIIAKITKVHCDNGFNCDNDMYYIDDDVIRTSYDIFDLLEPMDLMYIDISPDDCGGIVVPRIAETLRELNKYKELIKSGQCILKSVITHEMLKSMQYKVN